jgi:hypothetical protein
MAEAQNGNETLQRLRPTRDPYPRSDQEKQTVEHGRGGRHTGKALPPL